MTPKIQFELKCQNNPKLNTKNTVLSQNFWRLRNIFWAVKIFYVNKKKPFFSFFLDDKFSKERVTIKKRFGLLPTQKPAVAL